MTMQRGNVFIENGVLVIDLANTRHCRDITYDILEDGSIEVSFIKEKWDYYTHSLFDKTDPEDIEDAYVEVVEGFWKKFWFKSKWISPVKTIKSGWIKYKSIFDRQIKYGATNWRIKYEDRELQSKA
jgi:hypothetical protein